MKWTANSKFLKPRRYEIRYDPFAGFYLYVFEHNECIRDYLQDTLELAKEYAFKDYGVPISLWKEIKD